MLFIPFLDISMVLKLYIYLCMLHWMHPMLSDMKCLHGPF